VSEKNVRTEEIDEVDSAGVTMGVEHDAKCDSEGVEEEEEDNNNEEDERRVTFASVNDLHRGCYVLMKGGFPCKVVEVARSKQGKHGSAKVSITALDIFTGKKYEDLYPSSKNVEVPEVVKTELEVLGVENGNLLVKQAKDGKPHQPVPMPEDEIGERIKDLLRTNAAIVVQLQYAMGKEKIVMARERRAR